MLIELTIWHLVIFLILLIISFFLGGYLKAEDIKEHWCDAIFRSREVLQEQFSEQLALYYQILTIIQMSVDLLKTN